MNDLVPKLFVATVVGAVWVWVLLLVSAFAPPVAPPVVVAEAVAPEAVGAAVLLPDDNEPVFFAIVGLDFFPPDFFPPDFFTDFFEDFDVRLDFAATIFLQLLFVF